LSNTRVTDKILEKPYFSRVGIMQALIIRFRNVQFQKDLQTSQDFDLGRFFVCILNKDNGIIYIGLACYLLLQQIFLGAGKSLNEQYEFVSALLTQISWTNHL
jgi:hypothetical protein